MAFDLIESVVEQQPDGAFPRGKWTGSLRRRRRRQEFRDLDPAAVASVVAAAVVVDARHALDADAWRSAGWRYVAPGRPLLAGARPADGVLAATA